jgi:hypothetical protein
MIYGHFLYSHINWNIHALPSFYILFDYHYDNIFLNHFSRLPFNIHRLIPLKGRRGLAKRLEEQRRLKLRRKRRRGIPMNRKSKYRQFFNAFQSNEFDFMFWCISICCKLSTCHFRFLMEFNSINFSTSMNCDRNEKCNFFLYSLYVFDYLFCHNSQHIQQRKKLNGFTQSRGRKKNPCHKQFMFNVFNCNWCLAFLVFHLTCEWLFNQLWKTFSYD